MTKDMMTKMKEFSEKVILLKLERDKAREGWEMAKNKNAILQRQNKLLQETITEKDKHIGSLMSGIRREREEKARALREVERLEMIVNLMEASK